MDIYGVGYHADGSCDAEVAAVAHLIVARDVDASSVVQVVEEAEAEGEFFEEGVGFGDVLWVEHASGGDEVWFVEAAGYAGESVGWVLPYALCVVDVDVWAVADEAFV